MNYDDIVEFLYSKGFFSIKLGLERVEAFYERVGRPASDIDIIHVAGTNGKGSTCSFIESALAANDYSVGVFTSPHLIDFRERIKIRGHKVSKETLVKAFKDIKDEIRDESFFEILTILALRCFEIEGLDFIVLEVGMGGRLDATNVVKPIVSVITDISLEHTEHLGNTIEEIAYEKSGIIKEGIDVVVSPNNKGEKVIKEVAHERGAFVRESKLQDISISSKGRYQKYNVSTAYNVLKTLRSQGVGLIESKILSGFQKMKWPGRFDFAEKGILLDCAHNVSGAETFVNELNGMGYSDVVLVVGIMKNKNIEDMCIAFNKLEGDVVVCRPSIERAAEPEDIMKFMPEKAIVKNNVCEAIEYAKEIANGRLVAITGSIFTVGEAFGCLGIDPFNR